jgi:hypothetical protein
MMIKNTNMEKKTIMEAKPIIGIIKFFRNENHLNELCAGKLHCSTPEFYRMSNVEGVADKNECVTDSYRRNRGDKEMIFKINGIQMCGIQHNTLRGTGMKDRWLHCWTLLINKTETRNRGRCVQTCKLVDVVIQ